MAKVRISKQNIDEELFIKTEKIKINNKSIRTPIKSFHMRNLRRDTIINPQVKGVNEIFRQFNRKSIEEYMAGVKDSNNIYKNIDTSLKKTSPNEINFCFIKLTDQKLPKDKEIDFITNIAYIKSDVTPLPLIENIFKEPGEGEKDFERYTNFMSEAIESINRLNNKPILGVIPSQMPEPYIEFLIDFYHQNDITSFAFDFAGKSYNGMDGKIRELMTKIIKLDISNESLTYSCNTNRGKVTRGTEIIKANDILVYNYGFDIMGDDHTQRKLPPNVAEKLKSRGGPPVRLFNNEDYGHYNLKSAENFYPHDETNIMFESFETEVKAKRSDSQKLFNSERTGIELLKYNEIINESESTLKYLKTKNQIKDDLKIFTDFRDTIKV